MTENKEDQQSKDTSNTLGEIEFKQQKKKTVVHDTKSKAKDLSEDSQSELECYEMVGSKGKSEDVKSRKRKGSASSGSSRGKNMY